MVLSSGWHPVGRPCPVLASPNLSASEEQARVSSFLGRVDEEELNLESETAANDRVACRSTTRDATVCHQAAHQKDTRSTPTARSEEFESVSECYADRSRVRPPASRVLSMKAHRGHLKRHVLCGKCQKRSPSAPSDSLRTAVDRVKLRV
ncbi:UNVERIFIED_CONTAM: hypothetical protein HHA_453650 [Hammondia hammondi]|eukprot:XP_008886925.1 hypothetical protein HHA_453650 [Hammondia hammondi]